MNDVARHKIGDLCDTLTGIDVINLEKYDVSCYQLILGATFENSTVKAEMATEAPVEESFDGSFSLSEQFDRLFGIHHFFFLLMQIISTLCKLRKME